MEVFGKDLILGQFRLSDHGMMLASFDSSGESEDDTGISISTIEEFIGGNPTPKYLGDKYTDKIKPKITFVKDPCTHGVNMYFSEKECRNILRTLTGIRGYQWMKVVNDGNEDDIWFRSKIVSISSKRVGSNIVGLILDMECDSPFGWSAETLIDLNFEANKPIRIFSNTDDLYNYIYPVVTITFSFEGDSTKDFTLENITDNRKSEIKNVRNGEKITIDSKNEVITSEIDGVKNDEDTTSPHIHKLLLNDFTNMNWIRLLPDANELVTNMNARITFRYRVPRKVVLL